jgi:hypothetical protein
VAKARVESLSHEVGRRSGRGCCTLEGQGMSYGTQPHDWKLGELEYAGIPCLVFSATEHGIFSGRWEIDLTLKSTRKLRPFQNSKLISTF